MWLLLAGGVGLVAWLFLRSSSASAAGIPDYASDGSGSGGPPGGSVGSYGMGQGSTGSEGGMAREAAAKEAAAQTRTPAGDIPAYETPESRQTHHEVADAVRDKLHELYTDPDPGSAQRIASATRMQQPVMGFGGKSPMGGPKLITPQTYATSAVSSDKFGNQTVLKIPALRAPTADPIQQAMNDRAALKTATSIAGVEQRKVATKFGGWS